MSSSEKNGTHIPQEVIIIPTFCRSDNKLLAKNNVRVQDLVTRNRNNHGVQPPEPRSSDLSKVNDVLAGNYNVVIML